MLSHVWIEEINLINLDSPTANSSGYPDIPVIISCVWQINIYQDLIVTRLGWLLEALQVTRRH